LRYCATKEVLLAAIGERLMQAEHPTEARRGHEMLNAAPGQPSWDGAVRQDITGRDVMLPLSDLPFPRREGRARRYRSVRA
jgi:hypothetical protein